MWFSKFILRLKNTMVVSVDSLGLLIHADRIKNTGKDSLNPFLGFHCPFLQHQQTNWYYATESITGKPCIASKVWLCLLRTRSSMLLRPPEMNQVIFHSSPQAQYFPANSNFIKGLSQSSACSLSKTGKMQQQHP